MGKGTIRENLGEGHYRVALEIDVRYAREQLASIQQYLDAFQKAYQDASDRKDQAKAALSPLNARLSAYLATAQAESEIAYADLQAAYAFWRDLVAAQPEPGALTFLRQALTEAAKAFDAAHAAYQDALLNQANPDIPTPAEARSHRSESLVALAVAQGQWSSSVGPIQDETAVNAAYDQVGVALDAFDAATLAYADAVENLSADQAQCLSAMNFYQAEFNRAHSDWIKSVEENSGSRYVKKAREAYDQAVEHFESKQKILASLLDNGGLPAELAAIQADLEKAYKHYRIALDDYQSLTLLKVEKTKARDDLLSKLLPFTEADGVTEKHPVVNAWCADWTDTLSPATPVATVEIPGERQLGVRIRPQFGPGNGYTPGRDGRLQPSFASSPEATFWNWSLHPGAEKWRPRYRLGRIQAMDPAAETCTVVLDPQKTGETTRARDGQVLDVNSPVKTVVDPQSGQQQPILPSINIQVENGATTLFKVPIQYMDCGADAFEIHDHVLVEFTDRLWAQPRVIGFAENPKPCVRAGLILTGIPPATGVREGLFLKDVRHGGEGKLVHPSGGVTQGGNLDWVSADGKTTLTFKGPPGRSIAPAILSGGYDPLTDFADEAPGWRHRFRMKFGAETSQDLGSAGAIFVRTAYFGSSIVLNGKTPVAAPPRHYVLGAGVCRYEGPDNAGQNVTKSYLVAVFCGHFYLDWAEHEEDDQCWDVVTRPEVIDHVYAFAPLNGTAAGPWHILHTESLSSRKDVMPPINAVFFSANGTQCATCIPTLAEGAITQEYDDGGVSEELSYQVGNDLILRAQWRPTLTGVTLESVTQEDQTHHTSTYQSDYAKSGPADHDYDDWSFGGSSSQSSYSSAILAIDYRGEEEVTLTISASSQSQSLNVGGGHSVEGSIDGDVGDISSSGNSHSSFSIQDSYRQTTIGHYLSTYETSASESWSGSDPGGEGSTGSLGWAVSNVATRHGTLFRPYYYDLRTGAGLWYTASGSTSYASGHSGDLVQGPSYWTGNEQGHLSAAFEDREGQRYGLNATSYASELSGPVHGTPTLQGSGVSGSWSHSTSGNPATESGCNRARAQHQSRWEPGGYSWSPVQVMPVIYAQGCNNSGDIVCRIDFRACPKVDQALDAVYWWTQNRIDISRLYHYQEAFATAFDLDAAWMTHLATYHQPPDGSGVPLQTAFEGGVVPEFRR
jgi:tetratricopeptide (TPR) repeat protein